LLQGTKTVRKNGTRSGDRRARIDLQSTAKARQAAKLAEIREALVAAGYDTTAKQAAVLGVCRATAWVVLNRDKRAGPSASVIKRMLLSPNLPLAVRRKVEEYIQERISGLYGHGVSATRAFSNQFDARRRDLALTKSNSSRATSLELYHRPRRIGSHRLAKEEGRRRLIRLGT
jgi:hypothetical protein